MRNTRIMIAAAALFAATQIAGVAQARSVTITSFTGETTSPTATANGGTGYTTGTHSAGPTGTFKVRDAKTGKLVAEGKTKTADGSFNGTDGKNNYQSGKIDLPPGEYTVEVWQVDGRGNSYKAEQKIKIKTNKGSQGLVAQLEPQTDSEVAMDEAADIQDEIDVLRDLHDKALDKAAKLKNPTAFRVATDAARIIWRKMEKLQDKYLDKRQEAANHYRQEQADKKKTKVAEQQSRLNTANTVQKVQVAALVSRVAKPRRMRHCLH